MCFVNDRCKRVVTMISYKLDKNDVYFFADIDNLRHYACEIYEHGEKPKNVQGWTNIKVTGNLIREILKNKPLFEIMGIRKIADELDLVDAW